MPVLVRTLTAESHEELAALVADAVAKGWLAVGNPIQLRVGGHQEPGRATWMQFMGKS